MAGPRDDIRSEPERTPFTAPAPRYLYVEHPIHGRLMVNADNWVVTPIPGKPAYPSVPMVLPRRNEREAEIADRVMSVPQPHMRKCALPGNAGGVHGERGCSAAVGNGCPILSQYAERRGAVVVGPGPKNMILEKHGNINSFPCYFTYCGITPHGRPTAQAHYLIKGWRVLTDRTTIPENIINPETGVEEVVEREVPDLAPFYDQIKAKQATAKEEPKRRGRPRKTTSANREDLGT